MVLPAHGGNMEDLFGLELVLVGEDPVYEVGRVLRVHRGSGAGDGVETGNWEGL